MAVTGEEARLRHPTEGPTPGHQAALRADRVAPDLLARVCPYLVTDGGGWRSIQPTRDHRCGAIVPAVPLAVAKQRELCLWPAHATCATHLAAREVEASAGPGEPPVEARFWPPTSATILALEPARARVATLPRGGARAGSQAVLVGLMVVAFVVLAVARTAGPTEGAPGASLAAGLGADASPSTGLPSSGPVGRPSPSPTAAASGPVVVPTGSPAAGSPSPSPSASANASPTPPPASASPATTYTVRAGDTLSSIAAAHGTTVRKLRKANGLTGNVIRPGQVLVIP